MAFLMLVILLEALAALALLVLIVWWTMFHGRRRGELRDDELTDTETRTDADKSPRS